MKYSFAATKILFFSVAIGITFLLCAQPKVEKQINQAGKNHAQLRKTLTEIISKYKATVGLSVIELETGDTISINKNTQFAMQSVSNFHWP